MKLDEVLDHNAPPIIAILRGIRPDESVEIASALFDSGIRIIEVPLNSPQAFDSICLIQQALGKQACIGAGTVLDSHAVEGLAKTGADLMVTPNTVPELVKQAIELGLTPMPGFVTPTEALASVSAGARHLKLFPSSAFTAAYLNAISDVLPKHVCVWAVGGTNASNLGMWLSAGCRGIGVGGGLYKPGDPTQLVAARARGLIEAWKAMADV